MPGAAAEADRVNPLRLLHPDSTFARGAYRLSLDYWRKQPTDLILGSLRPGSSAGSLTVKKDGTVMQGNTRVKVLLERGYNVNALPRVDYPSTETA